MADHGARDHATWSASATARNWHCAGALALSLDAPHDKESIHAARGTAAHQLSEKCLRGDLDPGVFLGEIEQTKAFAITIDEEIVDSARVYVGYVNEQRHYVAGGQKWTAHIAIEQRFDLSPLGGPFDAGGTADAVISREYLRELEVVDLKHGVGVVDVIGNPQLRTYALGAMLANPGKAIDFVKVTIVQPRVGHRDGRIRSETFSVGELIDWTGDLLEAMDRSKKAIDERGSITGELTRDAWAERWLRPGKCKFCPAEGWCPALRKRAIDVAGLWFDDGNKPIINTPPDQSPEAVGRDLAALDLLEDWIAARRRLAHAMAEAGNPPTGFKLVDSHGHRKWAADEQRIVADLQKVVGLTLDDCYDRKLKSPAAIEKATGVRGKRLIQSMWLRSVTGRTLVREESDREAAGSVADRYFETEN